MSTYVPIQAITLSSAVASIEFTGIPQTYTDLVLVSSARLTGGGGTAWIRLGNNSFDTGSNYSATFIYGNGTTATSGRFSNIAQAWAGDADSANFVINTYHFQNYSNTTTNKTILTRGGSASTGTYAYVQLWRSTAAINQIQFSSNASNTFVAGSTFTLYGVGSGAPKAFGGDEVRTDGSFWYHIFRSSGRFEPTENLSNVDYLVVAGGGGGGTGLAASESEGGGGGGAGGVRCTVTATGGGGSLESPLALTANTSYTVTIGAGGAGITSSANVNGNPGSNSVFGTITSTGGGFGGRGQTAGGTGGSGGGGGAGPTGNSGAGGARTASPLQGFAGGAGSFGATAGGGGGAGAVGGTAVNYVPGAGGAGITTSISGSSVAYGGGGGGVGLDNNGGAGGTGGGGAGGVSRTGARAGTSGTANTGGGGGGGSSQVPTSGSGGSGIVIIRYAV